MTIGLLDMWPSATPDSVKWQASGRHRPYGEHDTIPWTSRRHQQLRLARVYLSVSNEERAALHTRSAPVCRWSRQRFSWYTLSGTTVVCIRSLQPLSRINRICKAAVSPALWAISRYHSDTLEHCVYPQIIRGMQLAQSIRCSSLSDTGLNRYWWQRRNKLGTFQGTHVQH